MKSHLTAAALVFALVSPAFAEWIIEAKMESPQMNSAMVTKIKGDKVRADIASGPMGAMSSIIDTASGESIQLLHAQKMAMKTSAAQMKQAMEMAKKMTGAKADAAAMKPKATGEKEKVGEYECEIWTWTDGSNATRFWVASKHPQADALKAMDQKMRSGALGGMTAGPDTSLLPGPALKTETTAMGMKTTVTIVSVKQGKIEDSDFQVPTEYQTMAMPTLPTTPAPTSEP
jgi:hypothetical protein